MPGRVAGPANADTTPAQANQMPEPFRHGMRRSTANMIELAMLALVNQRDQSTGCIPNVKEISGSTQISQDHLRNAHSRHTEFTREPAKHLAGWYGRANGVEEPPNHHLKPAWIRCRQA